MRAGIGFTHWNRVDGSKLVHCLQQCSAAPHLGQLPFQSISPESCVEQLKHLAAATFCSKRGKRGPVISMGGRGPVGFGRSVCRNPLDSLGESMYPLCLYLRSSSIRLSTPQEQCSRSTMLLCGKTASTSIEKSQDRTLSQTVSQTLSQMVGGRGLCADAGGLRLNYLFTTNSERIPHNSDLSWDSKAFPYSDPHFSNELQGRVNGSS